MLWRKKEVEEYLKRIRETISESEAVIQQAELRIAETDKMLEEQGLTREQVRDMKPTAEQIALVNEELERRGLGRLPEDGQTDDFSEFGKKSEPNPSPEFVSSDAELENRKRKFTTMIRVKGLR